MIYKFRNREINCDKTRLIGVVNVTPDSFSDGGYYLNTEKALARALKLIDDGADIIDIGGESSRPGAGSVFEEEEIRRVLPLVKAIRKEKKDAVISVDTTKASVAHAVLEEGADIINDISGLRKSQEIGALCARYGAGIILMHMRGTPATMREFCDYRDLINDIICELRESVNFAIKCGIQKEFIMIDPGVGFAKNTEQNLEIIKNWTRFLELDRPVLIGHSRKSFIGEAVVASNPADRLPGTCAISFHLAMEGVHFLRVHDVWENMQAIKMARRLRGI